MRVDWLHADTGGGTHLRAIDLPELPDLPDFPGTGEGWLDRVKTAGSYTQPS